MSNTNLAFFGESAEDPLRVALVKELTEKTKQGKVRWVNKQNAITATLPGGLEVNFVVQSSLLGSNSWQLFTLRDFGGNELIRATPSRTFPFITPPPAPIPTSLEQAIDELWATVRGSASADLDRAISTIKNL